MHGDSFINAEYKTIDALITLLVMVIKNPQKVHVILDFYKHLVKMINYFIPTNTLSCWVLPFAKVLTASVFYFHEKSTISTCSCYLSKSNLKKNKLSILNLQSSSIFKRVYQALIFNVPFYV